MPSTFSKIDAAGGKTSGHALNSQPIETPSLHALGSAWRGLSYVREVLGVQPSSAPDLALADVERELARLDPEILDKLRRDPWII